MRRTYDTIICGAGITGIAAAYYLRKAGVKNILLLDERPPLSLTSDRSTECYRNWWPDPAILALMNRSIDLMEELADDSNNIFHMNRRGYLFVTAQEKKINTILQRSGKISGLGGGHLRVHNGDDSAYSPCTPEGFHDQPNGADLLLGSDIIKRHFPYLTSAAVATLHVRRAGWLSAQQLGMHLLERARMSGVHFEISRVAGVDIDNGKVSAVHLNTGENINTSFFINAAGPFFKEVGNILGLNIPVFTELHYKAAIKDTLEVIERDAPLLIWEDEQYLPWELHERNSLVQDPATAWLAEVLPLGIHTRPEGVVGSQMILMLWEYQSRNMEPAWPLPVDDLFAEITMRGLAAMLPRMKDYFNRMPRPQVDGGYYTKTQDNRPLIGPSEIRGAYLFGAVSGYGIMSACGAADLLTAYITGANLPAYSAAFELSRFEDPKYLEKVDRLIDSGQL